MNVLVTGGAGYIGSHVVEELVANGYTPIVYDNFSTGHVDAVSEKVQLIEGDIHDFNFLKHVLGEYEIDGVLHFAASSQVGESMVNRHSLYTTLSPSIRSWIPERKCLDSRSSTSSASFTFRLISPLQGYSLIRASTSWDRVMPEVDRREISSSQGIIPLSQ